MTGRIRVGGADLPTEIDVLVVGLGVTGAGVALDAASRGLRVLAVEARDLAWGTSRWSSKLVHGGLRYLANGQVDVAHESAVERGILMEVTAPHLTRTLPMLAPLGPALSGRDALLARAAFTAGDVLRMGARTSRHTLPRSRRISAAEVLALAPGVRRAGLRGGLLAFDGQLEDDARLVIAIARTAAAQGADVRTRLRAEHVTGTSAELVGESGERTRIRARAVINATGVWAATVASGIELTPSRGTHVVLAPGTLPGLRTQVMAPIPHTTGRFVFVLPQPDGTAYLGLTDEEYAGPVPDIPDAPHDDVIRLLETFNQVLERPLTEDDVAGSFAGLRPLLKQAGSTADISRRHAVLTSAEGVVTIVGGKLTTYRRMAEDAVDATLALARIDADICRTRTLPLLGAAPSRRLDDQHPQDRLQRRFGAEADLVLQDARELSGLGDDELLAPHSDPIPVTLAELIFGVSHEGARTVDDLLDRRVRVGLIPAHKELARPMAERALSLGDPSRGRDSA